MIEKVISLEDQKAYEVLRSILVKNNCRIISEEPPKTIIAEHGYPSSLSPREAWKRLSFHLFPNKAGTRIIGSSQIIFPIPIEIINYLLVLFLILLIAGLFLSGIGIIALVGVIAVSIIYEVYYRIYRKRHLFLEEVFKMLTKKAESL